jgi:hypothetical protein
MPVASNVWNEVYHSHVTEGVENAVPLHVDVLAPAEEVLINP